MKREQRHTDLTRPVIGTDMAVVFLDVFVAIHLDVHMLVNMPKPCLVRGDRATKLIIVFLRHKWLNFWQLIVLDVGVQAHTDYPVPKPITIRIEPRITRSGLPNGREYGGAVEDFTRLFAEFTEVKKEDLATQADSKRVHSRPFLFGHWVLHVRLSNVVHGEVEVLPHSEVAKFGCRYRKSWCSTIQNRRYLKFFTSLLDKSERVKISRVATQPGANDEDWLFWHHVRIGLFPIPVDADSASIWQDELLSFEFVFVEHIVDRLS